MKSVNHNVKIIRYLDTGIFKAVILFSVGFSYDQIIKHTKGKGHWAHALESDKELIDKGSNFALQRGVIDKKTGLESFHFYIIIKPQFKFTDSEMCTLAHEVVHITQFVLKHHLDIEREFECFAYTHTHIMEQCLKEMREAYGTR